MFNEKHCPSPFEAWKNLWLTFSKCKAIYIRKISQKVACMLASEWPISKALQNLMSFFCAQDVTASSKDLHHKGIHTKLIIVWVED